MIPHRIRLSTALAVMVGLFLLAGCDSTGSKSSNAKNDISREGLPPENLRAGIPPPAQKVTEGRGTIRYTAPVAGSIYLYDLTGNTTIGEYFVEQGQEFVVAGGIGRATLGSNEVPITGLAGDRMYIIYFEPAAGSRGSAQGENGSMFRITPVEEEQ